MIQVIVIRDNITEVDEDLKNPRSTWEDRANQFLLSHDKTIVDLKVGADSEGRPFLLALYEVDSGMVQGPKVRKPFRSPVDVVKSPSKPE